MVIYLVGRVTDGVLACVRSSDGKVMRPCCLEVATVGLVLGLGLVARGVSRQPRIDLVEFYVGEVDTGNGDPVQSGVEN